MVSPMDEPSPAHEFARVKLNGERFAGGRLPVSALSELEKYTNLIREAAKLGWQEEHPGEELPEAFGSAFDLTLTEVEDGSADCVLELPRARQQDDDEYFDRARERVGREIREVLQGAVEQTDNLIAKIDAFGDLGSSLNDNESLNVPSVSEEAPVRITRVAHREQLRPAHERALQLPIISASPKLSQEKGWLVGRLNTIAANKSRFDLETEKYGDVHGFYKDDEILDDLRAVLHKSEKAPVIRIYGILQLYSESHFFRMRDASVVQVLEIDGEPWSRRFIELASLDKGWDDEDPDSEPVSFAALDGARKLLSHARLHSKAQPGLFPSSDGGVSVEWASPDNVYAIEVSPDAEFHLFHLGPDDIPFNLETTDVTAATKFVEGVEFK
ncbi:hypothetical protein DVG80_18240 [Rhodococcus erythropolis]|nr:hypothetical protein DVG80_18240 [Rhodococcus erythropolis]